MTLPAWLQHELVRTKSDLVAVLALERVGAALAAQGVDWPPYGKALFGRCKRAAGVEWVGRETMEGGTYRVVTLYVEQTGDLHVLWIRQVPSAPVVVEDREAASPEFVAERLVWYATGVEVF